MSAHTFGCKRPLGIDGWACEYGEEQLTPTGWHELLGDPLTTVEVAMRMAQLGKRGVLLTPQNNDEVQTNLRWFTHESYESLQDDFLNPDRQPPFYVYDVQEAPDAG